MVVIVTTMEIIWAVELISNSLILCTFVDKKSPRDECKINQDVCICDSLTIECNAKCCTYGTDGRQYCDVCDIDLKTGDYINCHPEDTIKFPTHSISLGNVTVGGVLESQQNKFSQTVNLNTTHAIGTFNKGSK